ncbi:MAG: hypothetical protein FWE47_00110 [Oscillospiraceae bacterium]|nr:hypothetical protein [Oscillospiraceae bacterium]
MSKDKWKNEEYCKQCMAILDTPSGMEIKLNYEKPLIIYMNIYDGQPFWAMNIQEMCSRCQKCAINDLIRHLEEYKPSWVKLDWSVE